MLSGPDRNISRINQQAMPQAQPLAAKPAISGPDAIQEKNLSVPSAPSPAADASQVVAENTKSFEFKNGSISFEQPAANASGPIANVGRLRSSDAQVLHGVSGKLDLEFMTASFADSLANIETQAEKLHASLLRAGVSEQDLKDALNIAATMNGASRLS